MRPRPETTEVTQFASKAINLLNFDSEDKTLYIKPLTKGYGYISVTGR